MIFGILKYTLFGTLSFTKFVRFVKSGSKLSQLPMPNTSEIEEKYSFSLVATSSDDVYRSLFMIISSCKLLFELLSLLLILRKCCQMAIVSFDRVTESEKMFTFGFPNQIFCLVAVFLYSGHKCLRLQASRLLRVAAISSLYQSGNFLDLTRLVLYGV